MCGLVVCSDLTATNDECITGGSFMYACATVYFMMYNILCIGIECSVY